MKPIILVLLNRILLSVITCYVVWVGLAHGFSWQTVLGLISWILYLLLPPRKWITFRAAPDGKQGAA